MSSKEIQIDATKVNASALFTEWFDGFQLSLEAGDSASLAKMLAPEAWWRDLLALTWNLTTRNGVSDIESMLANAFKSTQVKNVAPDLTISPRLQQPSATQTWIEGFFTFETSIAIGRGVVRLVPNDSGHWSAWTILTSMEDVKGHERSIGFHRPEHPNRGPDSQLEDTRVTWLEKRIEKSSFKSSETEVVIVGCGQGGVALAAHLGVLGVDTLVLEKNERVGDSWRKRYRSLVLHDPVWADHLPYIPFPASWPIYTAKDKLADWLEFYSSAMELNVWTNAEIVSTKFNEETSRWTVCVSTPEGQREIHPAHVVLATGAAGEPNIPQISESDTFKGTIYHSSKHESGKKWSGRKAIVVGACNSGHDIAQDLFESGAEVTLLQRSSTYIMSQKFGIPAVFGALYFEGALPTEYADLLNAAFPWPLVEQFAVDQTRAIAEMDHELLEGLKSVGFELNFGPDGGGLMPYALRNGGGYYINVGCSELIIEGKIKLAQGSGVEKFTANGVVLEDGRELDADLVVFATGYSNMRETARRIFGDEVADRSEAVLGVGEDHELGALWKQMDHPGFWYMGGPLAWVRVFSKYLAFQIKGELVGLRKRQ